MLAKIAVSVPSFFAPMVTRCVDDGRLPLSVCSASRSLMQRTARPWRFANSAATYVCGPAPFFAPKPPPM